MVFDIRPEGILILLRRQMNLRDCDVAVNSYVVCNIV